MKSMRKRLILTMLLLALLASIIAGFTVEWQYASYVSDTTDANLRQARVRLHDGQGRQGARHLHL
jgi:multidrug resistance efflux pump